MCGIVAIKNHPNASSLVRLGLHSLQHRGEESVGIASTDGEKIKLIKKMGLVGNSIKDSDIQHLSGNMAIGQVRYSTKGSSSLSNSQPLYAKIQNQEIAIVHNGHISNAVDIRKELENSGSVFRTTTDTEVILHLIAQSKKTNLYCKLEESLQSLTGAYSLAILTNDDIIIAKDSNGIRPLIFGRLGDTLIAASESCAINLLGGEIIRDVNRREQTFLTPGIYNSKFIGKNKTCIFEYIYFARPDSVIENKSVHNARIRLGERLAKECPADADICMPVPDSGMEAAIGYSRESGIPYENGILRTHYAGRTFIQPEQVLRDRKIRMKLSPVKETIKGKRVVVVDDSIVRGSTSKQIVKMLRKAGATEIHFRVSSSPVKYSCHYGIDTPTQKELIAAYKNIDEIKEKINVDTLGYLSYNGMVESIGLKQCCNSCFTKK